ncbi:unnamed protein product [Sphacelaria rigidula]
MLQRFGTASRRPVAALAVAGGAGACWYGYGNTYAGQQYTLCEAPVVAPAALKEVAQRLGLYVKAMDLSDALSLRKETERVKIYGIRDEAAHKAAGGLPVVRAAQTIIKAPVDEVALCWWQAGRRKEWDSVNTQNSEMVRALDTTQRLVYLQGKPKKGGLVSSRDFCYVMYRAPPEMVGAKAGSVLFVQANNPDGVPLNKASTRGDVNSLLLLEPVDPITTKVVKAAADETPLTLAVMRDHLEKELNEEAALSPEAAAKHALHRRESDEAAGKGVIAGAWATRKDLLETKKLLENQLKKVTADERKSGLDLSSLRAKIKEELAEVERRL